MNYQFDDVEVPTSEILGVMFRHLVRVMAQNTVIIENQVIINEKLKLIHKHLGINSTCQIEGEHNLSELPFYKASFDEVDQITDDYMKGIIAILVKEKIAIPISTEVPS